LLAKPHIVSIAKTPYYVKQENTKNPYKNRVFWRDGARTSGQASPKLRQGIEKKFHEKLLNSSAPGGIDAKRSLNPESDEPKKYSIFLSGLIYHLLDI